MINETATHETPLHLWYTSECHYEFIQDADHDEWIARKVANDEAGGRKGDRHPLLRGGGEDQLSSVSLIPQRLAGHDSQSLRLSDFQSCRSLCMSDFREATICMTPAAVASSPTAGPGLEPPAKTPARPPYPDCNTSLHRGVARSWPTSADARMLCQSVSTHCDSVPENPSRPLVESP